jgi:hypothetical protein
MSLEKLMDKYNPLKGIETTQAKVDTTELQSWKDSAPVIRLSEYMKMHQGKGIYLYQRRGRPYLYFEPGIVKGDRNTERWQIAFNTTVLFFEAADDLEHLISKGLIEIATQPIQKPEADITGTEPTVEIPAGPSPASEMQGS